MSKRRTIIFAIIIMIVGFVCGWVVNTYGRPPVVTRGPIVVAPRAPVAPIAPRVYNTSPCYRQPYHRYSYGYGYGYGFGLTLGFYTAPNPYTQTQYYYDSTTGITWYWTPLSGWQPLQ